MSDQKPTNGIADPCLNCGSKRRRHECQLPLPPVFIEVTTS